MPLPHNELLHSTLERCDRTRSAEAREALSAILWQTLFRADVSLTPDCILSRHNDILAAQEAEKSMLSVSLWQCGLCGKQFLSEHFLDKHLARRHALVHSSGHICLADLCGIFTPCYPRTERPLPSVSSRLLREREHARNGGYFPTEVTDPSPCRDRVERRVRIQACEHAVRECLGTVKGTLQRPELLKYERYLGKHLCHAAVAVECTRPERRWAKFGSPEVRYREHVPYMRVLGWILFAALVLVTVFAGIGRGRVFVESRHSKKRKSF